MRRFVYTLLCMHLALSCTVRSTHGQESSASSKLPASRNDRLVELITRAKNDLTLERLPDLEKSRLQLDRALGALENFIQVGTSNGDNWSKFLRLAELREQMNSQRPAYPKLLELEMNMRQNYLGLEYPQFTQLREALGQWVAAARFYTQEEAFLKTLQQSLDEALQELESAEADAAKIEQLVGGILGNLHQSNQSPQALQGLRSLYSQPNLRLVVNENLVDRLVSRAVAEPQPVDECILGTRILGQAFMDGHVSANLLPMSNGIGLQLNLSACMSSHSRGYNRGVVLNTTSSSPVLASKQVFLTTHGVSSAPAQVATNLQSTIHSIEHRLRIVRRIAQRKAAQQKPQADAIAEQRLQSRISTQFSQQVDQQVAQAGQQLSQLQRLPRPEIRRIGLDRPQIMLCSSDSAIEGSAVQAASYQMAAPQTCPLAQPTNASMVGQVHQSAINNALETVLGGRVLRSKDLGGYARQIAGKVPEELKEEIEGEEWSITFNPHRPIRIEFQDDLASITLRIVRMTRGTETLNEALSITTSYIPRFDANRLILSRQGEVTVTSDRETRGVKATALRSFLKSKFDKTFRETIETEPLNLARFPQLQNLRLDLQQVAFKMDHGWLQVAVP